jgi:hypothetical protein
MGDQMTWSCNLGFFTEMVGLSMLVFAIYGVPANGTFMSDFYFTCYGVQLIMKDFILGLGAIYVIVVRISKWFCTKDVNYTPVFVCVCLIYCLKREVF